MSGTYTESGAVAYSLAKGLLAARDLKGMIDGKTLHGADKAAVDAVADEHKAFEKKWKDSLDGFMPGEAGVAGRPFLSESLALLNKTVAVALPKPEARAREKARRGADALTAEFMKAAVFTTEGPGRVRVDWRPDPGGGARPSMPVSFRLLFEDGRWRSEAHLSMAPKEVLELVKEIQRGAAAQSPQP